MDQLKNLDRIQIVLVGTQDGANIGSVCRAMKTMGLTHLVLVTEREYDENRVRTLALHASDLWEDRKVFPDLKEALKTSVLTVAATRRHGKFRKGMCMSPEQLTEQISAFGEGPISIVFGREADGLSDEEVSLCSEVVTIPTSDAFPSLNLSQAVQVITYTLFNNLKPYPIGLVPVSQERCGEASQRAIRAMESINYFKLDQEKVWTERFLRDVFERAHLCESEMQKMEKIFTKMSTMVKYKDKENG
ncbi:MAG: RNA methyltransferase [Sphaerochaetaceae bacterium]